jgi:hypothetical protein
MEFLVTERLATPVMRIISRDLGTNNTFSCFFTQSIRQISKIRLHLGKDRTIYDGA